MSFKSIIALFMGLVIQWSQVQSCVAAISAGPSGTKASHSCCCAGLESCPCVSDRDPDHKPAPLVPTAVDLKQLVARTAGPNSLDVPISPRSATQVATASREESRRAYAGVPLSVAFCCFVI